jgi:hypothetical protein
MQVQLFLVAVCSNKYVHYTTNQQPDHVNRREWERNKRTRIRVRIDSKKCIYSIKIQFSWQPRGGPQ